MAVLPAERLVEVIERRLGTQRRPVVAYWYTVVQRRDDYAEAILASPARARIIPLIPRRADLFGAPNALLSDLIQLVEENRGAFERWDGQDPLVLLVLSRSPLAVPGGCSPATLPSWLPRLGGTIAELAIEDLTFSADAPLNSPEARVPTLCASLFALERAMLRRLGIAVRGDPRACEAFFSLVGRGGEKAPDLLTSWEENAQALREPQAFRPSVREGRSVVARLVGLFSRTTPDQLMRMGDAVANALGLDGSGGSPFVAILFRPTQRTHDKRADRGRELLTTVFAAYQYVTAAAHADDYQRYPVGLLDTFCRDLAQALEDLTAGLE